MGAYAGVAVLAGLLFYFFNPSGAGDCSFNISVITMTLVLALVVSAVSMLPYVRPRTRGCRKGIAVMPHCPFAKLLWSSLILVERHAMLSMVLASGRRLAMAVYFQRQSSRCTAPTWHTRPWFRSRTTIHAMVRAYLSDTNGVLLYGGLLGIGPCGLRPGGAAGVGHKLTAASASTLALGMALALLAVVWSALRAGSNTALFRLGLEDAGEGAGGAAQPLVGDDEEGRAFVQARPLPVPGPGASRCESCGALSGCAMYVADWPALIFTTPAQEGPFRACTAGARM